MEAKFGLIVQNKVFIEKGVSNAVSFFVFGCWSWTGFSLVLGQNKISKNIRQSQFTPAPTRKTCREAGFLLL